MTRWLIYCVSLTLAAMATFAHAQIPQPISKPGLSVRAQSLSPGQYVWDIGEGVAFAGLQSDTNIRLSVSLADQRLYVYRGEQLIGAASVSTGKRGHSTPKGDFPISQKRRFHRSNKYSNAPMPFMQRLTWTGIALHSGRNPGYPASHGCIRLPHAFARDLFAITRPGTVVTIAERPGQAFYLDYDYNFAGLGDAELELAFDDTSRDRPHWYPHLLTYDTVTLLRF